MSNLLQNDPDLLEEFTNFLPEMNDEHRKRHPRTPTSAADRPVNNQPQKSPIKSEAPPVRVVKLRFRAYPWKFINCKKKEKSHKNGNLENLKIEFVNSKEKILKISKHFHFGCKSQKNRF